GLDTKTLCNCANTFCSIIKDAGYTPMVYFNCYIGYLKYDLSKILNYDFWLAQYSNKPTFYYDFKMWQYSSTGSVNGISGNVDMNICFAKY
ncbi:MAG: GH25 family lysozyme, partial [Oscillospiraceae bacterium]|nr:GH25 family lysozyme [Oscillospiraceae bacterium]